MKKAFKAFSAKDKLYHINRINSKLIHYSTREDIFLDKYEKSFTILEAVKSLKTILECFDTPTNCKRKKLYLESIIQIENKLKNKDYSDMKVMFSYMAGCFERFRNKYKKSVSNFCEKEYHSVCIPLFQMELKNRKKAPNNVYKKLAK